MCSPAGISASVKCPKCEKKVNEVMGNIPNICPFCEEDLTEAIAEIRNGSTRPIPAAPKTPTSPPALVKPPNNSKQ